MIACKERAALFKDWHDAVMIVADCMVQMQTCSDDRFEERYHASLLAMEIANETQARLMRHHKQHGC
jgi:hypothetical protein